MPNGDSLSPFCSLRCHQGAPFHRLMGKATKEGKSDYSHMLRAFGAEGPTVRFSMSSFPR